MTWFIIQPISAFNSDAGQGWDGLKVVRPRFAAGAPP